MEPTDASTNSSIATNDSANSIDQCFKKWGLHTEIDVPPEIEFDLTNQVSLHIGADICGILGDINGDSGTINTNCSAATAATSKSLLPTPINYLIKKPPTTPPAASDNMLLQDDATNASSSSADNISTSGNNKNPNNSTTNNDEIPSIEATLGAQSSSGTEDLTSDDRLNGSKGD